MNVKTIGRGLGTTRNGVRLHVLALAALATAAFGVSTTPVCAQNGADDDVCVVAGGVNGLPRLISPDGAGELLVQDMAIPSGYIVQTGVDSRCAIAIKSDRSVSAKGADLVHLAHNTQVEVRRADATAIAAGAPPVLVVLLEGSVRTLVRHPQGTAAVAVQAGERTVHLDGADIVMVYSPDRDTASHIVFKGTAEIHAGRRRIKVIGGMSRLIEEGKIRGATKISDSQIRIATKMTAVSGVVVTMVGCTDDDASDDPGESAGDDPDNVTLTRKPPAAARSTPTTAPTETAAPIETAATTAPAEATGGAAADEAVYVRLSTSHGDIVLELDPVKAPKTVKNFLSYVRIGFYKGTIFHRVIKTFMIQGGGFDADFQRKPTHPPVENEWRNGLKNVRGTISMARLGGRPDSATSQFFLNVEDNASLDRPQPDGAAYAVFGRVVAGMDVVDAIKMLPVKTSRLNPREQSEPVELPMIRGAEVITREQAGLDG